MSRTLAQRMSLPPPDEPDFGQLLLDQIREATVIEKEGWAPESAMRVADRLQFDRPTEERFEVVVYWATLVTAFTVPGRLIFFSRRLLERCRTDEMIAFVIAHEIAHHDLGHVDLFPTWMKGFTKVRGGWIVGAAAHAVERRLYGPERECHADRHALQLCSKAGYDPVRCLEVFQILEAYLLDMRRDDLVYGLDPESDRELSSDAPLHTKIRIWAWTRAKGYLPVQDRVAEAMRSLENSEKAIS